MRAKEALVHFSDLSAKDAKGPPGSREWQLDLPPAVAEFMKHAREACHDALGIAMDPEAIACLSVWVMVFAEGVFADLFAMSSRDEAIGFAKGVGTGPTYYGGDQCHGYLWPDDLEDMRKEQSAAEIDKALKRLDWIKGKQAERGFADSPASLDLDL